MIEHQKLVDFFMDELPEDNPWCGNVKGLVEKVIELCERSLNNDGTGHGIRFTGGDVTPVVRRGVTVQKWIPVTERLPKEDERVLVWVGENDRHFPIIDTDRVHNGRWVRWGEYITHYMPLTEPPKGE